MIAHEDGADLELRDYVSVLLRRKWTVISFCVVALGLSILQTSRATEMYEATTEILLQPKASELLFVPGSTAGEVQARAQLQTEIEVMASGSVIDAVTERLGRSADVSIDTREETWVVAITAADPVPTEAARITDTYAEVYLQKRRTLLLDDLLKAASEVQSKVDEIDRELGRLDLLEDAAEDEDAPVSDAVVAQRQALLSQRTAYLQQLGELQLAEGITTSGGGQIITEATVPLAPFSPRPLRSAASALVIGMILGVGIAFLREFLDDSVKSKEDLARAAPAFNVLALVSSVPAWRDRRASRLVVLDDPTSAAAESYRSLRTAIQFMSIDTPLGAILVTSTVPGEGKTTTSANLATVMARAGQRVILVSCDLRRPRSHEFFGLSNDVGFTSVMLGEVELESALQAVEGVPRLQVLASGPPPPNPSELLSSTRALELMQRLRGQCDIVIVDSPPILPVTDAIVLSKVVDGTVLVATVGRATRRGVRRAVELLAQVEAPVIGTVLNGVSPGVGYGYGSYDYRYSGDRRGSSNRRGRVSRTLRRVGVRGGG